MAKKVLKVTDFSGGVNAFADARDIKDNEFTQAWNASLDRTGVVRVTGGGAFLEKHLALLPSFSGTNNQRGFGLFQFSTDYTINQIDGNFNTGIKTGGC